jgi:hypothetical protein
MQSFVSQRYSEAYIVTSGTVTFGRMIKVVSVGLTILALLAAIVTAANSDGDFYKVTFYGVEALIVMCGVIGFLGGIIIMGQGQMMLAVLDTAVNTSVVASIDEKVEIFNHSSANYVAPKSVV